MGLFYVNTDTIKLYLRSIDKFEKEKRFNAYRFDGAPRRKRKLFWGFERGHLRSNTRNSLK